MRDNLIKDLFTHLVVVAGTLGFELNIFRLKGKIPGCCFRLCASVFQNIGSNGFPCCMGVRGFFEVLATRHIHLVNCSNPDLRLVGSESRSETVNW